MKSFKIMGFGPRKSKSGFTLIELLIVMVIIAILAGVIVMAVGGVFGNARSAAYNTAREQIQNAVTAYSANASSAGQLPANGSPAAAYQCSFLTGTVYVVNISALLASNSGMLRTVPDGVYVSGNATVTNTNINGSAPTGYSGGHYIWEMDSAGTVASVCVNIGGGTVNCNAHLTVNGYQNVWP